MFVKYLSELILVQTSLFLAMTRLQLVLICWVVLSVEAMEVEVTSEGSDEIETFVATDEWAEIKPGLFNGV